MQSQLQDGKENDPLLLEAEVLQVHAPPFVTKENTSDGQGHAPSFSRVQKRRSFLKKKGKPAVSSSNGTKTTTDDQSVPKDIDLIALPQLCFPGEAFWTSSNTLEEHFSSVHGDDGISCLSLWLGGLKVVCESQEDSYHFLVFTDVFGNQTHGVVVQYYKPIQVRVTAIRQLGWNIYHYVHRFEIA